MPVFGVTMRPFSHFFIAVRDGTARQNDRLGVDRVVIGLALGLNADNGAGLIRNETSAGVPVSVVTPSLSH